MNGHVGSALVRNRFLLLGFLSLGACAQEGSPEPGALGSYLTAAAGSGASCMPLDSADTVPDGVDEDCDGKVDEDVDATRARCPRGTYILEGTRNDETLRGTAGRDCILGYGGNDIIFGGSGDDVIFGGPGNDRIYTGRGNSVVRAGGGDDMVDTSGSLMSLVYGDAGNDTLTGGLGIDTLHGGAGNDRLSGGGGADILSGGECHDSLVGGTFIDLGNGGPDVDACDTELSSECERSRRSRVSCELDSDCSTSERCAVHVGFCVPKSARECGASSCVPTGPNDVTCDGADDDCDGAIDDDFVSEATSCGMGGCGSTGETSCVDGEVVDSCSPGSPAPNTDSVCDGVDDDCDGATDEGFVPTATSCGIGVCAGAGMRSCVAGTVVDSCQAGLPGSTTDTVCNGSDDDCDGSVDEEFNPAATSCGVGVCAATGLTSCVGGALTDSCEPGAPISTSDTTCNAADDDCNGLVDDGYVGVTTTCGYGECETSGTTVCASGYVVDSCVVECEGHCADGGEDDGDGAVDCADSDCAENPLWPQCVTGAIASGCTTAADCMAGSDCSFDFPGGYCFSMCSAGCPAGSVCWEGVACVQPCVGPNLDACPRPDHECAPLVSSGSTFPFCRPTCDAGSCLMGTCGADSQCQ